jgi:hypothetical protein
MNLVRSHLLLDLLFQPWRGELGNRFEKMRRRAYRVYHFARHLTRTDDPLTDDKLAMLAAFWTNASPDGLSRYLQFLGRADWREELTTALAQSRRLTRCEGPFADLAESFRQACWAERSRGWWPTDVPELVREEVNKAFPR